jgi:hypothetical protein
LAVVISNHATAASKLVDPGDAASNRAAYGRPRRLPTDEQRRLIMYVVVQHTFTEPQTAFSRGERLIKNHGAPTGVRGLQFYPAKDGSRATCLWEADSVEDVQGYVDSTLGDSSDNHCYEVDAEHAFAEQPLGLPTRATRATTIDA